MTAKPETAKKKEYDLNALKQAFTTEEDSNSKTLALSLIDKAEFLNQKLKELQDDIDQHGLNVEMRQGNYSILRANPSCSTYTAFIKNYNSVVKQLIDLLPKNDPDADEFRFFD